MHDATTDRSRASEEGADHAAPPPRSGVDENGTDRDDLEALTDEENRADAERDPDAVSITPEERRRLRRVPDPAAIRQGLGLTREAFSPRFEIPLGTPRDREQGRRFIDGAAGSLLRTIALAPDVVAGADRPHDPPAGADVTAAPVATPAIAEPPGDACDAAPSGRRAGPG